MIKGKKQQKKICHSEFISESCNRNGGQMLNLFWHDKSLPKAFTLAELLIALAILGLIAVLTIPFVAGNLFAKSYRAKAEAARETVLGAINSVYMTERVHSIEDSSVYNDKEQFFHRYIKTAKHCGTDAGKCFGENYKTGDGNFALSDLLASDSKYYVVFSNGASVGVYTGGEVPKGQVYFVVDANGKGRPNQLGVDTYAFAVFGDGTAGSFGDFNDILAYVDQSLPDIPGGPGLGGSDPDGDNPVATDPNNPDGPCSGGAFFCSVVWKCDGNVILTGVSKNQVTDITQCAPSIQQPEQLLAMYTLSDTPANAMAKCTNVNPVATISKVCDQPTNPNPDNHEGQCASGLYQCTMTFKCDGTDVFSSTRSVKYPESAQCPTSDSAYIGPGAGEGTPGSTMTNTKIKSLCKKGKITRAISKTCYDSEITDTDTDTDPSNTKCVCVKTFSCADYSATYKSVEYVDKPVRYDDPHGHMIDLGELAQCRSLNYNLVSEIGKKQSCTQYLINNGIPTSNEGLNYTIECTEE